MLLVIFGAGASYDSVLHLPPPSSDLFGSTNQRIVAHLGSQEEVRPPIANQLFDNRPMFVQAMDNYAACKPLVNLLRGKVQVEKQLARFEEDAKAFPPRYSQLAAIRYYLQQMLWNCQQAWRGYHHGVTNYATFLDVIDCWCHVHKEQVCYVTFNYDTMVEESITELWGWVFSDFSSYTTSPQFKLIKLHGSIDWGHQIMEFRPGRTAISIISDAATKSITPSEYYQRVGPGVALKDGSIGFPALAIPVDKKSEFSCPTEHLSVLAEVLPKVTKIITIGWRATEQHFLTMLKTRLTGLQGDVDLMVVSGDLAGVTQTNTNLGLVNVSFSNPHRYATVETGFSGLIRDIPRLEAFLA